jgi:hypothetical protein
MFGPLPIGWCAGKPAIAAGRRVQMSFWRTISAGMVDILDDSFNLRAALSRYRLLLRWHSVSIE